MRRLRPQLIAILDQSGFVEFLDFSNPESSAACVVSQELALIDGGTADELAWH